MDFEAAIFDLDGTLLDSLFVWHKIDRIFLNKRGIEVPSDYSKAVMALGIDATAEYTIKRFGLSDSPLDLINEWEMLVKDEYANNVFLKPYAKEYLSLLKNNKKKLAVCTALIPTLYIPVLKNNGIYEYFDGFTTVSDVGKPKSEPDAYLNTAEKIGIEPEKCIVFEDIPEGIGGAKKAHMTTVGVYEASNGCYEEEMKRKADKFIYSYKELL